MKLFQHSQGFVFAFRFDMMARKPDPHRVSWCDPGTLEWEMKPTNQAGYIVLPFRVDPEFVSESAGKIIAYQPGRCVELQYIGAPLVWSMRMLQADAGERLQAA